ncbi:MAG: DNA methyltransferase Dim-2 [Bogoriella megaspora]|nr:MAG: DNA methyltransferase Dim-2 [Bogoriella megaspora]
MDDHVPDSQYWKSAKRRRLDHIYPGNLTHPKSQYDGWVPPDELASELEAIRTLQEARAEYMYEQQELNPKPYEDEEYMTFELSNFSIYRHDEAKRAGEMVPLHQLQTDRGHAELMFDGVISYGTIRRYVQAARFSTLTLEGYGDDSHGISQICIQSNLAKKPIASSKSIEPQALPSVYYSLSKPSAEYERYYEPFHWIATFTKHFVDYLSSKDLVYLDDLRNNFSKWITERHQGTEVFEKWMSKYGRGDFRQPFVTYSEFLWKETFDVDQDACKHPIWTEGRHSMLGAIRDEGGPIKEQYTLVTPYAYACFKHMYFGDHLKQIHITDPKTHSLYERRMREMDFIRFGDKNLADIKRAQSVRPSNETIRIGTVIAVARDQQSKWKDASSHWYAYVQSISKDRKSREILDVIWMYRPEETTLAGGQYPWNNELFFSDHCNCGDEHLLADDVLYTIDVDWHARCPRSVLDFFARQKYCTRDSAYSFIGLQESDFVCHCKRPQSAMQDVMGKYKVGSSVLVRRKDQLEPCIITGLYPENSTVAVRMLARLHGYVSGASPNELAWTKNEYRVGATSVVRKCYIGFFSKEFKEQSGIPAPFVRNGAGDCWFVTAKASIGDGVTKIDYLKSPPSGSREHLGGLTPISKPLPGLDLFCGYGGLGHGIEEAGVAEMKYGVDNDLQTMHTWRANAKRDDIQCFLGSVNRYFALTCGGTAKKNVAPIGTIGLITSGNPCKAFSTAQTDRQSKDSIRNASLVASVVAHFDIHRPRYGVLENVPTMAANYGGQNVFAQILCAFVGMGYQVQQFILDAWSCGNPQSRGRLFIIVTAPHHEPLSPPSLTHAHPSSIRERRLGTAVNGQPFGERRFEPAYSFPCVTAADAVSDLPYIDDSHVQTCIPYPDHRTTRTFGALPRSLLANIPIHPPGANLIKAIQMGYPSSAHTEKYDPRTPKHAKLKDRHYSRVKPDDLFSTVTTVMNPDDYVGGRCLHWDQHRILTTMEVRRAQGVPDDEVLIGASAQQHKLVGNAVARGLSVAIGMALREAWVETLEEGR